MATLQELEEGLRKAHAAGNAEHARAFANAIRGMRSEVPQVEAPTLAGERLPQLPAEFSDLMVPGYEWTAAPENPSAPTPSLLPPALTGGLQGATLGAYDEVAALLGTPVKAAESLMTGADSVSGPGDVLPFLGRSFSSAQEGQQGLVNQAYEDQPWAANTGDVIGSLLLGGGMANQGASLLSGVSNPTIANMLGRGAVEGAAYGAASGLNRGDTAQDRIMDALVGGAAGGVLGGVTGGVSGALASRQQTSAVPSVQNLLDEAGELYHAARQSGAIAGQAQTQALNDTMRSVARGEGLISPSGNINQSYPKITSILNTLDDFASGDMDVSQIQAVRRILQDAARSADAGEKRIGSIMLSHFDDFAAGVAPELREASGIYARAKMGELIQRTIDLAETRAGQFSQSGMENALRTEFRNLNRQIIRGTLKGVTPELQDAIKRVADGGALQNFARWVGRFAPSGNLSTMLSGGAGYAIGGPVGAAGVLGAGAAGKQAAEAMTMRNAEIASALARSGGALPEWQFSPVVSALIAGQASEAPRMLPDF